MDALKCQIYVGTKLLFLNDFEWWHTCALLNVANYGLHEPNVQSKFELSISNLPGKNQYTT